MKKIAIIMPTLLPMPPVKGGAAETLVDGLLRENEKTGRYRITLFCVYDKEARRAAEGYGHTEFRMIKLNSRLAAAERLAVKGLRKTLGIDLGRGREYMAKVISALRREDWDAVIVENEPWFSYRVAGAIKGAPVFAHIHNDLINADRPFSAGLIKRGCRVIAVSRYIAERVLTVPGVMEDRVSVLLNCAEVESFGVGYGDFRRKFRAEHGVGEDEVIFIYAGRVIKEKGVLELARAFAAAEIPGGRLMIVGGRWYSEGTGDPYAAQVREALEPVKDRVIITGYVPYGRIAAYYAASDAAVLPSIWEEPASLTVLESMASGLPVITTDSGGIPETAKPGCAVVLKRDAGLINSLVQAMRELAGNPVLRAELGEKARRSVSDRNYANYFEGFFRIIDTDTGA